jgi:hypothetical protein
MKRIVSIYEIDPLIYICIDLLLVGYLGVATTTEQQQLASSQTERTCFSSALPIAVFTLNLDFNLCQINCRISLILN